MTGNQKITNDHLSRTAIVYLRQSSFAQMMQNKESQQLQYNLAVRAKELGWKKVSTIDDDLGTSASEGSIRKGFRKMIAAVASGEVGIIFSREASRLSRTDKDWCQLLEICRICKTLISDAENIYDLAHGDDQLILGIKATLSIAELSVLKSRLIQGMENKARRGELYRRIPPGYLCVDGKNLVKDPDQRIQDSILLIFKKFREVSSVRQLMKWFHEEKIKLPVNKSVNGKNQLAWQYPKYTFLKSVLKNPTYAGVYFYGHREIKMIPSAEHGIKKTTVSRPVEDARIYIKDHHEKYISLHEHEENLAMIKNNNQKIAKASDETSGLREGYGLLTGLLRCGRCGRKLHIRYWGKKGTAARYLCAGNYQSGGKYCLGFGGATIDKRIGKEILRVIEPLSLEASFMAIENSLNENEDKKHSLENQIKQTEYETQRAFEQYDQVDPRNRLVAAQLEERWNRKLTHLESIHEQLKAMDDAKTTITEAEKIRILKAGKTFEEIWDNIECPMKLKKKLVRILLKEIVVNLEEETDELHFLLHWHGGDHTEVFMKKPLSAVKKFRTSQKDIEIIRTMAVRYRDDEIARVLSKLGRTTAKGLRWNESRVASVRNKAGISPIKKADADSNILSLGQAVKYSGVSDTTLTKLINKGILKANQIAPYAPLEICMTDIDSEPVKSILDHLKLTGKLVFEGVTLPEQQRLFQ